MRGLAPNPRFSTSAAFAGLASLTVSSVSSALPAWSQRGASAVAPRRLRGRLTDLAASLDALALAAAVLGSTPLVIARLVAGL